MTTITVDPARIRQFGDPEDATFCLVTNAGVVPNLELVRSADYREYKVIEYKGGTEEFARIMRDDVPTSAHVLVMSPDEFFISPPPDVLGSRRKLLGMACNSTPTDYRTIKHFLRYIEATDPMAQERFSDRFFELAERGELLQYRNVEFGTVATMPLFERELTWNQQAGLVDWGEQQIVPSGEISVLPIEITDFGEDLSLPLNGEIVIRGYPILHSGTPSFSRIDQQRIYENLRPMIRHAMKASVRNGRVVDLEPLDQQARKVTAMFEAMFAVDSRYQIVWEIGHALNTTLDMMPGNLAMNEVYGGVEGCLHWGFGLTPYTQYHLDIISPGTIVTNEHGEAMLGQLGTVSPERVVSDTAA